MARRRRFATVLAYLTLEFAALLGAPIRPEQIEEMTRLLNRTQVVYVEEDDNGGDPPGTPDG
jgi:hypothetical protein